MIRGNTSVFIGHPLPKDSIPAHGASHHVWAPGPHHLNPALATVVEVFHQQHKDSRSNDGISNFKLIC